MALKEKCKIHNINLHIKKRQPLPTAENEQLMHLSNGIGRCINLTRRVLSVSLSF